MLKEPTAIDRKGEEQTGSGSHLWTKKVYKLVCVDVLHLDGRSGAKHTKLKTILIGKKILVGKKILENSVIFV